MVLNVTDRAQHRRSSCLEEKEQANSEQSRQYIRTVTL